MQRVKKGDTVQVISGDDKGARGEVHAVHPKENRVVVQGINLVKKHQRRTGNVRTQVGIIEFEAPLQLSNVMPVCRSCDAPVRVGYRVEGEGRKVRHCRKCDAPLDN